MKKTKIFYWIFTILLVILMLLSSVPDIFSTAEALAVFRHLGYPVYISPFLGIAKLLGVIAILVPGFAKLKEWAYAGFVFDLSGAVYSGIAVSDPVAQWAPVFIGFVLIALSYIFYHRKTKAAGTSNFPGYALNA